MLAVTRPGEIALEAASDIDRLVAGVGSTTLCSKAKSQAFASDSRRGAERPFPTRCPISCRAMK